MRKSADPAKRRSFPVRPRDSAGQSVTSGRATLGASGQKSKLPQPRTSQNPTTTGYKLKRTGSFASEKQSLSSAFQTPAHRSYSSIHTPGSVSSSVFASASKSTVRKKDPALNYNEKDVQRSSFHKIYEFFACRGQMEDAERFRGTTLSLGKKDFLRIVTDFIQDVDPTHKALTDVEREIPELLKKMGCNLPLTRNSFVSIGALHSTGLVLAVFVWLIDLLEGTPISIPDDEAQSLVRFRYREAVTVVYGKWMGGSDNYQEEYREWRNFLGNSGISDECYQSSLRHLGSKRTELASIEDDIRKLESQSHDQTNDALIRDRTALQEYNEQLHTYNLDLEQDVASLRKRIESKREKIAELQGQVEILKERRKNQPVTKRDFEVQRQQIVNLKSDISLEEENLRTVRRELDDSEITYAKVLEESNEIIKQFRTSARAAQLIPQQGSISFDPMDYSSAPEKMELWSQEVKPAMREVLDEKRQMLDEVSQLIDECEKRIQHCNLQEDECKNEVNDAEYQIKYAESEMADLAREEQEKDEELEEARRKYAQKRRQVEEQRSCLLELEQRHQNLAKDNEGMIEYIQEREKQAAEELQGANNELVEADSEIRAGLRATHKAREEMWIKKIQELLAQIESLKDDPDSAEFVRKLYADYAVLSELAK